MRALLSLTLLALSVAASANPAQDWRWKLDQGKSYAYAYRSTTDLTVRMSLGMTGEVKDRIGIDTDFAIKVERVLPDGRYDVVIPITGLTIQSASGQRTTLRDIPPQLRTLRAYMTPKGRFSFYERVVIEVREGGAYGIARVQQKGEGATASATVAADGVEITASATIDPKTGRITIDKSVREQPTTTRKVEEERPVQQVDVLPADVLGLLELPEGPVAPGDSVTVEMPMANLRVDAGEPKPCGQATCGNLRMRVTTDSSAMPGMAAVPSGPASQPAADDADDDMDAMFGEVDAMMGDDGFGGMPSMGGLPGMSGLPGMGGSPASAVPTMKMSVDVTGLFDAAAGRMHSVAGTGGSTTDAMGLSMVENTTFELTFSGVR